jgi:DNA-damage-inducible protein J
MYVLITKGVLQMAQTTLSIRMDENVKKQFDAFCTNVGMNTSVAINLFAKAVLRERRIPFEIALPDDPFYSDTNQIHLRAAIADMENGKGIIVKTMEELENMENE